MARSDLPLRSGAASHARLPIRDDGVARENPWRPGPGSAGIGGALVTSGDQIVACRMRPDTSQASMATDLSSNWTWPTPAGEGP